MKQHTTLGGQMFKGSRFPAIEMAREIALEHHERWDGAGYPFGKKGPEIALVARIVAVAQSYDALLTGKPHQPGYGALCCHSRDRETGWLCL